MKKLLSITIVILLSITLTSCKSNSSEMNNVLSDYMRGCNETVLKSVSTIEDEAAIGNSESISISAKQAINDRHNLIVLLEVTSSNNIEFNYNTKFKEAFANIKDMDGVSINNIAYYPSKNKKSMNVILSGFSKENLNNQLISLKFIDLYNNKTDDIIEKAQWNLEFELNGEDITKVVDIQESNSIATDLRTIEISPYSIYASFEGNKSSKIENIPLVELDIKIIMKTGEEISVDLIRDNIEWDDSKTIYTGYVWGKPINALINLDDIESISINDTSFNIWLGI